MRATAATARRALAWLIVFGSGCAGEGTARVDPGPLDVAAADRQESLDRPATPTDREAPDASRMDVPRPPDARAVDDPDVIAAPPDVMAPVDVRPLDAAVRDAGAAPDDAARDAGGTSLPGGWRGATYVFSAAAMITNDRPDDRVEIGWIETDASRPPVTACGDTGPWARRSFYRWSHNGYPRGECTQDVIRDVALRRWDHVAVTVDGCPGPGSWQRNGRPTNEPFLRGCAAHVPAGFGQSPRRITWTGRSAYDPARRTLVFHYDTPEGCQREYYRDLTLAPDGSLLSMSLDGARSRDTGGAARGLGNTRGYAYGSTAALSVVAPFRDTIDALANPARTFLEDAWHLREADSPLGAEPDHDSSNDPLGMRPQRCGESVAYDHSCGNQPGEEPYLRACAAAGSSRSANLRFIIDAFAPRRTREMLFWEWFAHHAGDWSGCYHNGSHARPVLQIVDARGLFRGFVGVEIQRSQRTVASGGSYVADPDGYLSTDYRVFRWIERGLQERAVP